MKIFLTLLILYSLFILSPIYAQPYLNENSTWQQNLTSVYYSAIAWGDIDKDADTDLVYTGCIEPANGIDCDRGSISKIYINNGVSLVESSIWEQNLTGLGSSSVALGDIDSDGDLDLAITGCSSSGDNTICQGSTLFKIYINNGTSLVLRQLSF